MYDLILEDSFLRFVNLLLVTNRKTMVYKSGTFFIVMICSNNSWILKNQ